MLKKLIGILVVAGALAFLSPYYAVTQLTEALEAEDAQAVDKYVDFDAVRGYVENDMRQQAGGTGIAGAIGGFVGAAAGSMVTPDTMVAALKDQSRRDSMGMSSSLRQMMHRGQWHSADQFIVHNTEGRPTMLLTRRGIGWEVTGIKL